MTMADTIAVMNKGVIEQMGAPADLYENPRTTFVANFLGQSNLIEGEVVDRSGTELVVDVHRTRVAADREHVSTDSGRVWVGIRPEKLSMSAKGKEAHAGGNTVPGGVVSDVSFIGVSTLYLVQMPWGQELTVFEQNTGAHELYAPGTEVDLHWNRDHAFLLDADQVASAGVETVDD